MARLLLLSLAILTWSQAQQANAAVYLNGSLSQSTSNAGYLTYNSSSGSAGVDVSLGTYVRVGVTHQQEFTIVEGWSLKDGADEDSTAAEDYHEYSSRIHVLANSLDFTFILYNGAVVVPYIKAGLIWKDFSREEVEDGSVSKDGYSSPMPGDNLGAGVGFKLSQQFTLKLLYMSSPGQQTIPGDDKKYPKRDKKATVGLSYEL